MNIQSTQQALSPLSEGELSPEFIASERLRRKQIVNGVLLVIIIFQLVQFPGALLMQTTMALVTVLLGLALCGVAVVLNQLGRLTVVGILLILVVDLGCGLMLLTSSMGTGMGMGMGLGVGDLPVLDVLIISELIAVSLLPPASVFVVAFSNILFILTVFAFFPRSMEQLQSREAELLRREAERSHQLEQESEHLLQVLVRAANGDIAVRAVLPQNNALWRVGNAVNMLLSRLRRVNLAESQNRQLRQANVRLTQRAYERNVASQQTTPPPHPTERLFNPSSNPGKRYG